MVGGDIRADRAQLIGFGLRFRWGSIGGDGARCENAASRVPAIDGTYLHHLHLIPGSLRASTILVRQGWRSEGWRRAARASSRCSSGGKALVGFDHAFWQSQPWRCAAAQARQPTSLASCWEAGKGAPILAAGFGERVRFGLRTPAANHSVFRPSRSNPHSLPSNIARASCKPREQ